MTEKMWLWKLQAKVDTCGCEEDGATIKPLHGDWYVSCWNCRSKGTTEKHAYKALDSWNEARRGEKR